MSPSDPIRSEGKTRLTRHRLQRDLSQAELAAAAGMSKRTLERIEHGTSANPGVRDLLRLAAVLGCGLEDLIEDGWRPNQTRASVSAARRDD